MPLALSLFLLVLLTEFAVKWVGLTAIRNLVYEVYLRLFLSEMAGRQRALKKEILENKAVLMQTSAQDQFATWAKLRRKVDKGLADLEKLNGELGSARTSFQVRFDLFMMFMTTVPQWVIGWWYRRSAVFYLPPGWLGPATWWLSFPFAPAGSVSCGVWQMACKRVIKIGERLVKDFFARSETSPTEGEKPQKAKAE